MVGSKANMAQRALSCYNLWQWYIEHGVPGGEKMGSQEEYCLSNTTTKDQKWVNRKTDENH